MATKYVLGAAAARKLRAMMAGRMGVGRVASGGGDAIDESAYPHPYTFTWAESSGEAMQGGGTAGAWIIWLPEGSLTVNGVSIEFVDFFTRANNYPNGWYDLTSIFGEQPVPKEFDLYLDPSETDPRFVIDKEKAAHPILIASVNGRAVKGVVESALFFGLTPKPFDIVSEEEDGDVITKIVRCVWMVGGNVVQCNDFTIPDPPVGGLSIFACVTITPGQTAADGSTYSYSVQAVPYGDEPEASESQGHENDTVFFAPLYDMDKDKVVLIDYRDALVTLDWIGADEVSTSYGGDGDSLSYMHLHDFYNANSDVQALPSSGHVVCRVPNGNTELLKYVPISLFNGGGGGGGSGGGDQTDNVQCDELSVSKGGDGWSATDPTTGDPVDKLHMVHFHDTSADMDYSAVDVYQVTFTSLLLNMWFVMRLNSSANELRYFSGQEFLRLISDEIARQIGDGSAAHSGENADTDVGGSGGIFAWTAGVETTPGVTPPGTIGPGGCMVGRQWIDATGTGGNKPDGFYSLKVTLAYSGATCEVVSNALKGAAPSGNVSYIPIYLISGGKIAEDYRGAFVVPAYE